MNQGNLVSNVTPNALFFLSAVKVYLKVYFSCWEWQEETELAEKDLFLNNSIEIFQASDTYFLESGDKIRYFFEVF